MQPVYLSALSLPDNAPVEAPGCSDVMQQLQHNALQGSEMHGVVNTVGLGNKM